MPKETAIPPRPERLCQKCDTPHGTTDYYVTHLGVECAEAYELRIVREARQEPLPRRIEDKA